MRKFWLAAGLLFLLLSSFLFTACAGGKTTGADEQKSEAAPSSKITIQMLDVGQGDALLLRTASQTIVIDSGDVGARAQLLQELQKAGVTTIDKLIITHPHADHIGGTAVLFSKFTVKEVYDNGEATTSGLYKNYLKTIRAQNIQYHTVKAGDVLDFGGSVSFHVLSPTPERVKAGGDLNGNSVVGRLVYGNFSMLFTGDSQAETEQALLQTYGQELKSTILKSPHHGSKTSSSLKYLQAVAPEAVCISVGKGNDYGHPHKVTLEKYAKLNCKVYRTDLQGTITIESDGKNYTIGGERQ